MSNALFHYPQAILFDLDGTLVDTAPDLTVALNTVLLEAGRRPLPLAEVRPHASHGTPALIALGFGYSPQDPRFIPLREAIIRHYRAHIADHSTLFNGVAELLAAMAAAAIPAAIVTNKPTDLTLPLLEALGLTAHFPVVVCGDTLPQCKPDPEPILYACRQLGVAPQQSIYVGDAERDMEAGRRAGLMTVAARYGYLQQPSEVERWGADATIEVAADLLRYLPRYGG